MNRLLVVLLLSIVDDVEELELVDTLGGGHDAEPVTELVLLEELLGAAAGHVSKRPNAVTHHLSVDTYRYLR